MTIRGIIGISAAAALTISLAAPAVAAPDPKPMGPRMLEQTVLRVQMPKTLGAWEQYLYRVDKKQAPTLCWSMKGAVMLPKAAEVGTVNYQVDLHTNGSVAIYQYATKAKADAALAALRKMGCSDDAKHPTEGETMVAAQQGSDFMDAEETSVGASVTYMDGSSRGYESTVTTQRGLAIVQTQVRQFVEGDQPLAKQQKALDTLSAVNKAWHAKVVKAYQSFGVEGTAS